MSTFILNTNTTNLNGTISIDLTSLGCLYSGFQQNIVNASNNNNGSINLNINSNTQQTQLYSQDQGNELLIAFMLTINNKSYTAGVSIVYNNPPTLPNGSICFTIILNPVSDNTYSFQAQTILEGANESNSQTNGTLDSNTPIFDYININNGSSFSFSNNTITISFSTLGE
jgi:hypothetical protein